MAIFGTSFQIGRSALAAYQAAIANAGQNIANVGNPDYTRQSGRLESIPGAAGDPFAAGAGVNFSGFDRHIDEAVENRLRLALGARAGAETTHRSLSQIESLYNELSDEDMSSRLGGLFGAFSNLQTTPEDGTARSLVLSAADSAVREFRRLRSGLLGQVSELNDAAAAGVREVNQLTSEIASLNQKIASAEARGGGAGSALRDRRDALLRQLSETIDVQVREQPGGSINVYVGSEPLVEFGRARNLKIQTVADSGIEVGSVRFADNNGNVVLTDGKLGAIVQMRDERITTQLTQLDRLASGLIYEVNRAHSSGRGLTGYGNLTGTYAVRDADAALNSADAGLSFPVRNGTFLVHVRDSAGRDTTRQIEVDLDGVGRETTLNSLAASLDNVPGLTTTVTTDGRLQITAESGSQVSFSDDRSGALAALGVATFFEGTDAATIDVQATVAGNPALLAASASGARGDGTNAGALADVGRNASALLGDLGIQDFHSSIVNGLAIEAGGAATALEAADTVYSSLLAQREAVSGVNLDEEAINLTKFERSFQGASRFLNVIDSLSEEILTLVG